MAQILTPGSPEAAPAAAAEPARRSWLKRLTAALGGAALAAPAAARPASPAQVLGDDVYVGEIMMFAGNYAPVGFALCNGQLLSIAQNTALFSLLGTMYGGDGRSTFALPNLQGYTPIGQGNGPGLTPRVMGSRIGSESVALTTAMAGHVHSTLVSTVSGTSNTPLANLPAVPVATNASGENVPVLNRADALNTGLAAAATVTPTGGSQPTSLLSPYLTISYCIALQGVFPARS
ncbi:phage tail protein [Hymenobacter monticola]|uniref:Tail fiber protein n=1 Tax=Hymenobacter monticola TaxID=1705399 RepID=A0ABY4AZJ7_9BACT|nr:tail fiber protein [Hymenobacter monticola]UOE32330.1 tail fiber protein [Hymenobacter monticola]